MAKNLIENAVAAAMKEANGDARRAATLVAADAAEGSPLYVALMSPKLTAVIWDAVRAYCRRNRRDVWNAPNFDPGGRGDRLLIAAKKTMIDNFRLPILNCPLLRDATHAQMDEGIQAWRSSAYTMLSLADFVALVKSETPEGGTPGQTMNERDFQTLKAKSRYDATQTAAA